MHIARLTTASIWAAFAPCTEPPAAAGLFGGGGGDVGVELAVAALLELPARRFGGHRE